MRKTRIIATALAVTILLSAAVFYTRPTGQHVSSVPEEKKSFAEAGSIEVEEGVIKDVDVFRDISEEPSAAG